MPSPSEVVGTQPVATRSAEKSHANTADVDARFVRREWDDLEAAATRDTDDMLGDRAHGVDVERADVERLPVELVERTDAEQCVHGIVPRTSRRASARRHRRR